MGMFGTLGTVGGGILGGFIGKSPAGVAAGSSIGGSLGGFLDSQNASNDAASAYENSANQAYEERYQIRQAAKKAALPTELELQQMEHAVDINERDLARREKLIASSDPALIEAGQQALKLLQGQDASTLAPIRKQRDQQRQQLLNQLRQRLGPGAEESAAGARALSEFDAATNAQLTGAQQSSLGMLLTSATNTSGSYGTQQNLNNALGIGGQRGALQDRYIRALQGPAAGAGASELGNLIRAQGNLNASQGLQGGLIGALNSNVGQNALGDWMRPTPSPYDYASGNTTASSGGSSGLGTGAYVPQQ